MNSACFQSEIKEKKKNGFSKSMRFSEMHLKLQWSIYAKPVCCRTVSQQRNCITEVARTKNELTSEDICPADIMNFETITQKN